MVQEPHTEPPPERIDIIRGTNYLLESLDFDRRIRTVAEFASPVLIPIYEKICSCRLTDVRLPVRNLTDEIHNIQCVINALCFETVEFDLSHISGEQVANGDLYAMEDLLEILTDVYHWIKNDEEIRPPMAPLGSDRSSIQASLGAQIAQIADRRRPFGNAIAAPNSLVFSEISPIVSPSASPTRQHRRQKPQRDSVIEDLQEKYESLLRRFEQTIHMSSDALNLSRPTQDTPPSTSSDLRVLLDDLTKDKHGQLQQNKHNDTFTIENGTENDDIEDDLALILNDKQQPQSPQKSIQTDDNHQSKSILHDSTATVATRNRLNHSDEFYQIRSQLKQQYNLKSNLNHFLKQHFNDDLEDYKSTAAILENKNQLRAMQHHDIDTSTLRIDRPRRSSSTNSKIKKPSRRKGFLRSSSSSLNVRPSTNQREFDSTTTTTIEKETPGQIPTNNKHRLLLANEQDLAQILNEQFPGIYVSSEMQSKLNDQFSKHIDNVFKARIELLNAQQGNLNDVEEAKRKHDIMTDILRKELGTLQRQQDVQLKQSAERILKSKMRDQRIQSARVRRYFQQYLLDQRKRLLKKRTNEELILKQAYTDSIRIQRERLYEMKKYKQQYNALFMSRYRDQLESLENYYRSRMDMFKEEQNQEATIRRTNDREEKFELNKQRTELRKQLENDIQQLQEHLNQNDDYVHFRQLDLERLKENLIQARLTSKV